MSTDQSISTERRPRGMVKRYDVTRDCFVYCPRRLAEREDSAMETWLRSTGETYPRPGLTGDLDLKAVARAACLAARAAYVEIPQ